MKLNALLAVTDSLRNKFKNMVGDYSKFFYKSQGSFLGCQNTYTAREGMIDDPSKRKLVKVVTTVDEKFDYFTKEAKEFIDALFSQERTNGTGAACAHLVVEGEDWGEFTSLELLRLKSLLESNDLGDIKSMLTQIPTRSDAEIWMKSDNEMYEDRAIFETKKQEGISRTTEKEEYILEDPNLKHLKEGADYRPQKAVRTTTVEVGDYTIQNFSGEWSQKQRAKALKNLQTLLTATIKALKECNDVEAAKSELTSEKIFGYILK